MELSPPIVTALVVIGTVTVSGVVLRRRRGRVSPDALPVDSSSLDAVSLAFLAGGPARAVTAALSQLRTGGFVGADGHPTSGTVPGLDPFDAVVLAACGRHRTPTVTTLLRDTEVRAATRALSDDLERRGLVDTRAARWALRAPQLVLLAGVGAAVLAAHVGRGGATPATWLLPTVGLVAVALVASALVRRVPIAATRRARGLLARARTDQAHLDPRLAPSFVTYGPRAAGLAVAVFGVGSVARQDPSFAAACGLYGSGSGGGSGFTGDSSSMTWLGGDSGCCGSGGGGCGSGGGGSDGGASCGSSCGGGGGGCGSGS